MSKTVRFLTSIVGNNFEYRRNDVATLEDVDASGFMSKRYAMLEPFSNPAATLKSGLVDGGYESLAVDPSGGGVNSSAPGGVYQIDDYTLRVVTPEHLVETIVCVKLH